MHEQIVGPAETNLSAACQQVVHAVESFGQEFVTDERGAKREHERAVSQARRMATGIIRAYLRRRDESILVDKSLTNVDQAELLAECFPEAHFICLYRHCLDVVSSLIEASPWGFDAYGAAPFVARSPANFVAGLVDMWTGTTRRQVEFTKAHPSNITAVRYEDLVREPRDVMLGLFKFRDLEPPKDLGEVDKSRPMVLERHLSAGAADYKIAFTRFVDTTSIGRGRTVPLAAIPPPLLEAANELLVEVGYDKVDEGWNHAVAPGQAENGNDVGRVALAVIVEQVEARLGGTDHTTVPEARVALEDCSSTLVIDFRAKSVRVEPGLGEPLCIGSSHSLMGALLGHLNVGTMLRRGELRICQPEETHPGKCQAEQMEALLELLVAPGSTYPVSLG